MTAPLRSFLPAVLVVAAALLAHGAAARGTFHYDDFHQVVRNEAVHGLAAAPRFFFDPATFDADLRNGTLLRPLTLLSYALDWARGGGAPGAFLATQVLLHALASALVLAVLRRALRDEAQALFGALVFAAHPLASESVNLVSARAGVLAAALVLLYLAIRLGGGRRALALAALGAACLAKESAVVAPALALALGAERETAPRRRLLRFAPEAALLLAYVLYRSAVLGGPELGLSPERLLSSGAVDTGAGRGLLLNLATQAGALLRAALLAVFPVRLSVDHAMPVVSGPLDPAFLVPLALLAAAAVALRRCPSLPVRRGALVFVLAAAPTILVPLNVVLAEERYYLSLLGVALAAGFALGALAAPRPRAARLAAAAIVLFFAARSFDRTIDFRSEARLWASAVDAGRAGPRAHLSLGNALLHAGETKEAVASYRSAVASAGFSAAQPFAILNLSEALRRLGAETGDAAVFDRACRVLEPLRSSPNAGLRAMARYRSALVLCDRFERFGDPSVGEAASREYRAILEEHPDEADAWRGLARVALAVRARNISVSEPAAPSE